MNHLTDDQIQFYLDNDKSADIIEIEEHLQQCEKCRFVLKTYQQIYSVIKIENEIPELSSNFSQNTIRLLEKEQEKKWTLFENILITFTFLISISASIYFFDLIGFISYFRNIDFSMITGFGKKIISTISPNFIYLAAAVTITIVIELLDRFKVKKAIKHLNH
jgi:hypothetical protein